MLDAPAVRDFAALAHKRSLPPKHTVIRPDDAPQSLYLVLEGSVSLLIEDEEGREIVLGYLNPGEFFGEMGLFPEQQLPCTTVRTRGPTLVAELDYRAFRSFVDLHPGILFELAAQLACRLRDLSQRMANHAFLDVTGRLTHTLMDLSTMPDAQPHPRGVVVKISRMELARHVGCSREMAGRVLKKLKNDGFVNALGRSILIYGAGDRPRPMQSAAQAQLSAAA